MPRLSTLFCPSTLAGLVLATAALAAHADVRPFIFEHEHVLGTTLRLTVWSDKSDLAQAAERTALSELDRLEMVFSTYRADSLLMRWQRGEVSDDRIGDELLCVLQRAEQWRRRSNGAFDARAAALGQLWKKAAAAGQLPERAELDRVVSLLRGAPFKILDSNCASRADDLALSLDAIAKGYILDRVCEEVTKRHPDVQDMSIMIGGDVRHWGTRTERISIASPFSNAEGTQPIHTLVVNHSSGVATSGGYRRFVEIDGLRYSHLVDPRTGMPANALASATVIAPSAMDADAAATAISVLGPSVGLEWIEGLDGYACLLVLPTGDIVTSANWSMLAGNEPDMPRRQSLISTLTSADEKTGLFVKFTLGKVGGGRYRKPYVAVWLEDKDGFPVKTAVLWLQTDGPGPRWHRDLTRWYTNDRLRKLAEETELIGAISGATRGPGAYEARFDGTDNDGKSLKPGKYTLCLEAAREHGTHQLIRETVELTNAPLAQKELKDGTEFSAVSFRYVPFAVTDKAR